MADTSLITLTSTWNASSSYTASGTTDFYFGNPNGYDINFAINDTSAIPANVEPWQAFGSNRKEEKSVQLADGETIYFTGPAGSTIPYYATAAV